MSYTKGPWKAILYNTEYGEPFHRAEVQAPNHDFICQLCGGEGKNAAWSISTMNDNALLCAAAPDLLEACKRAFTQIGEDLIDDVFPDLDYEKDYKRLHYMLGQAISKAEGREGK